MPILTPPYCKRIGYTWLPRNKIQSPFSYSVLFTQICLLEQKYNSVPKAGAKEHLKLCEKIPSQAYSLWPWHLSKKGGGEEISLGYEILYSKPPIYTEIPRKLLKVLVLKLAQPTHKIDAPVTRHTWSISFGLLKWEKKRRIIGTS